MALCSRPRASAPRPTLSASQVDRTRSSTAARSSAVAGVRCTPPFDRFRDSFEYNNNNSNNDDDDDDDDDDNNNNDIFYSKNLH